MIHDSFSVLLKRREGGARCRLIALFLTIYFQQMMKSGEIDVMLLYVERTPLNMSKSMYGYLLAVNYMCLGIFAFFGPWVLDRLMHLNDSTIAAIGLSMRITGLVVLCLSDSVWMVFVAAVVAGPHSLTVSSCKSMISKTITDGEMGKTFSLLSSGETLANVAGTVVFANLYAATMPFYAGTTFAVEGVVFGCLMAVVAVIGCLHRRAKARCGEDKPGSPMYTSP